MDIFLVVLSTVIGYLIGSISMSVLLSKLIYKGDVRNYGSHNAGATNMARVYGLTGGILTLAGDFLKAVVSMLIPLLIHLLYSGFEHYELAYVLAGMGCFVGHAYPLYFGFKGGKCVTVGDRAYDRLEDIFNRRSGILYSVFYKQNRVGIVYIGGNRSYRRGNIVCRVRSKFVYDSVRQIRSVYLV